MARILITGATGNIGMEVIRFLFEFDTQNIIYAGVRNIDDAKRIFSNYSIKCICGTNIGNSGITRDCNTSKTGHITIAIEQNYGVGFNPLEKY